MNPVLIELGPISIYWYSLTMLIAILTGSFIFMKTAKKEGYEEAFLSNLIFYGAILGILGARLYYVLFNLDYYLQDPIQIIEIWNGGLAIHGAIITGVIWFIYYSKKHKKNFLKLLDLAASALILALALGRWGNFFNSEAHGPQVAKETLEKIKIFLKENLELELNKKTQIFKNKQGVNFCGYKINEYRLKIRDKGKRKLKKKVKKLTEQIKDGKITSKEAKIYLCGHLGYMKYANVRNLKEKLFYIEKEE